MLTPAMRATCASPQTENVGLCDLFARAKDYSNRDGSVNPGISAPSCDTNLLTSLRDGHPRQGGECSCQLGLIIGMVLKLARLVVDVSLHVEVPVTAEIEQDRARDPNLLTA